MGIISRNLTRSPWVLTGYALYLVARSVYASGYATWVITQPGAVATNSAGVQVFYLVLVSMISAYIGLALVSILFFVHVAAQCCFEGSGAEKRRKLLSRMAFRLENSGNLFDDVAMLLLTTRFVFVNAQENCIDMFFWESLSLVFVVFIALGPLATALAKYVYAWCRYGKKPRVTLADYDGPYSRSIMLGPLCSFTLWIALSVQASDAIKFIGLIIGTLGSLTVFILVQLLAVRGDRGFAINVTLCSVIASAWTLVLIFVQKGVLIPVFCNDIALLITLFLTQLLPGILYFIVTLLPAEVETSTKTEENPAANSGQATLVAAGSSDVQSSNNYATDLALSEAGAAPEDGKGETVLIAQKSEQVKLS